MPTSGEIIPFTGREPADAYDEARGRLAELLIRHTLVESYANFARHGQPFPFLARDGLLPNSAAPTPERPYQNTAFVIMLDGALPRSLVKHFRVRESNRVTWRNIQRLAPHLDLGDYKSEHCRLSSPKVGKLLRKLATLDYALLVQRPEATEGGPCVLSHMHVKVERLIDNAIKDLGKALGYVDRRLFERGEDYVETLENKFYEYYGFPVNASGRKSAAAMAAQLLANQCSRFDVFVAAQDDCRLSVLDESDRITQYLPIVLAEADQRRLRTAAEQADLEAFTLARIPGGDVVVLYRLRLRRTVRPRQSRGSATAASLDARWLEIAEEAILPAPGRGSRPVPFSWAASARD